MLDESKIHTILPGWERLQWYYSIELCPGISTKGFEFNNIAVTRRMLANIDLDRATAIDIGAMEGAMSTIMAKRGTSVMSVDTTDRTEQIRLVQRAHGVRFAYFPEIPLHRFAERIFEIQASQSYGHGQEIGPKEHTNFGFDVVLSSGVMYHVLNPVDHLMTCRRLCKLGGLVALECAAAISDDISLFHGLRPEKFLYAGFSTWFVSTAALDLFLRACYLEPLAFAYVLGERTETLEIARVGVVSRAVSRHPFDPQYYRRYEEVIRSEIFHNKDFAMLQPAALLTGRVSKQLNLGMDGLYPAEVGMPAYAFQTKKPLAYAEGDLRLCL